MASHPAESQVTMQDNDEFPECIKQVGVTDIYAGEELCVWLLILVVKGQIQFLVFLFLLWDSKPWTSFPGAGEAGGRSRPWMDGVGFSEVL
ncbi:hypothetical protein AVEN_175032-1 [Araneus ventricosus]|uniref:Uncharacterized protein n=1 Tax=Araneus ventricosus TaxID=182803 RepID=A0A4Y2VKZ8_ARAVE|nr:hypothetical protein AVEN_175032-1 [Araneus ventricosus]